MIMDILVAGLLALVSFRSGMEYQNYRRNKARIQEMEKRIEEIKNGKPKEANDTQRQMLDAFMINNLEAILKEENPVEAMKEWLAYIKERQPEEGSYNA